MWEITVDSHKRRVVAVWGPRVTDAALLEYQSSVWSDEGVTGFDELIDFSNLKEVDVTSAGLRRVAAAASSQDRYRHGRRFAVVVGSDLAYGLSRMYEQLRELQSGSDRIVQIFKTREAALAWLDDNASPANGASPPEEGASASAQPGSQRR